MSIKTKFKMIRDNYVRNQVKKAEDIDEMIKHVATALKKFEEKETVAGTTFRLKK